MKRGVPARSGGKPLGNGDIDVAQLRQLIEIQTQIVKQAKQNEQVQKRHHAIQRRLGAGSRRLIKFISRLW